MNDSILLTGKSGFVGGNLSKFLEGKYSILGVSREKGGDDVKMINYKDLSVSNFNSKLAFIHLAGKAHDLKNVSKPEEYFEVNRDLTIRLFDFFLESDCKIFIFISSVKAVTDKVELVLTEKTIPRPLTPYGRSKLEAENYILSKGLPKNKTVYILRPCMIHGPNNKGNLNLLYKFISNRIPYPLGKFKNKRSFTSIENLCFIINKLLENEVKPGIYNVADDASISTKELVGLIGQEINKKAIIINFPIWSMKFIAKLGNFFRLSFNSHSLDKLTENYIVSNEKIKKELNCDLPVSVIQGLKRTIKSFK